MLAASERRVNGPRCKPRPSVVVVVVLLWCHSVSARYIVERDFDLETAAAEPRPIFIETAPSAQALPLVAAGGGGDTTVGPLTDASEKVEKVLRPALAFAYNNDKKADDGETAESKQAEDQKTAAVDYYKFIQDNKKERSELKGEEHDDVIDAGEQQGAESKHHHQKHDGGGHGGKFEKGGGKEFDSHHHGEHGEDGKKEYKGHHHHERGQKGHHDKEDHKKEYDENGGHKKEHHHEDGYHGEHHKSHGGKKGAKFSEEGEHSKGHSTKGEHSIHKKDEYEKKTEFFEEDNEGGETEKHGGFSHKDEYVKGGHFKTGHKKGGHHEEEHGKKNHHEKGGHHKEEKGHFKKAGHDHHHDHDHKHGHKEGHGHGKKWAYSHGHDDGGGGGGGGGKDEGHGSHSHPNQVVVQAPVHQTVSGTAPVQVYKIPPITSYVLPLEGEELSRPDGAGASSEVYRAVATENNDKKKRRPSPTDSYLADNPFSSSAPQRDYSFDLPKTFKERTTTADPVELFIREELLKSHEAKLAAIETPASDAPSEAGAEATTQKSAESKTVTKRRRLKKRKKDSRTAASRQAKSKEAVPEPEGHNKNEKHVPEETSHSFVIVAADDVQ